MSENAKSAILKYTLSAEGEGVLQNIGIDGSSHTITVEGPPPFGGTDSAASPLDHALAALLSCNQVTSQIVASGQGVRLGKFSGTVHAELDSSVLVFGAEGNANFSTVVLELEIETDLDDEGFEDFTSDVARRCPVTQLFVRSGADVSANWTKRPLPQH